MHCSRPIGNLILWMIPLLAAGAPAQDAQRPPSAVDKGSPTVINGEPVYKVGGDVTPPRAVYAPDPEYSEEARVEQLQGTCVLWAVVGTDGKPHDVRVAHSAGMGLDEKALEAIRTWRFEPAKKDGQPVAVQINVETDFRLYSSHGKPPVLGPPLRNGSDSLRGTDKNTAGYPLLVDIRFASGKGDANGYVVSADAAIPDGGQTRKATISCGPKGKCFMLNAGRYPARWLNANELEVLGRRDGNGKWQKAQFSVAPAS